jgi:hypothetical protein
VRHGLIGADRAPELLAIARVLDGHLHGALRHAGQLGRHGQQPGADAGSGLALEDLAGSVRPHAREAPRRVHRRDRLDVRGRALDHAYGLRAAQDDHVGLGRVGNELGLVAPQQPGRAAQLAGRDARQPALLLGVGPGRLDQQAGGRVR